MVDLVCSNFDNVVLVYNAANTLELGFVDDIITGDALEGAKTFLADYTQYNVNSTRAIKRLVASECIPLVMM